MSRPPEEIWREFAAAEKSLVLAQRVYNGARDRVAILGREYAEVLALTKGCAIGTILECAFRFPGPGLYDGRKMKTRWIIERIEFQSTRDQKPPKAIDLYYFCRRVKLNGEKGIQTTRFLQTDFGHGSGPLSLPKEVPFLRIVSQPGTKGGEPNVTEERRQDATR